MHPGILYHPPPAPYPAQLTDKELAELRAKELAAARAELEDLKRKLREEVRFDRAQPSFKQEGLRWVRAGSRATVA
jgi:hypothetical protein